MVQKKQDKGKAKTQSMVRLLVKNIIKNHTIVVDKEDR